MTTTKKPLDWAAENPLAPYNPDKRNLDRAEKLIPRDAKNGDGPVRPLLGIELTEVFANPVRPYPGLYFCHDDGFPGQSFRRNPETFDPRNLVYVTRHPTGWCLPVQNPDGKTPTEVEVDKGYRLVTEHELRKVGCLNPMEGVEFWSKCQRRWCDNAYGRKVHANTVDTFRTKRPFGDDLSQPAVECAAPAVKYANPDNVKDHLLGSGFRFLTEEEISRHDGQRVYGVDFWWVDEDHGDGGYWHDGHGYVQVNRVESFRTKRPIGDDLTKPAADHYLVVDTSGTPRWETRSKLEPPSAEAGPADKSDADRLEQIREILDRLSDRSSLTLGVLSDAFRKIAAAAYAGHGTVEERPRFKFELTNAG